MNRLWIMAIAATGLAACGIPDSSSFTAIPDNEIPRAIRQTLPPTSTSTTTTTTTTLPTTTPTTIPGSTTTVGSTTTTTTVPSEQIQIYYVQGNRIRAVTITERSPVTVQRKLLDLTEREGMSSHPTRVATVLPIDATLISGLERGVVTVELGNSVDTILPVDLPLFFAQITLTALAPSRQGQVRFTRRPT